jgi:hypothetical protein
MKRLTLIIGLLPFAIAASAVSHAATIPCEDTLKQLREAEKTATLSDADKAAAADLEQKGIERCNADDDKRANKFFADALKIVTKK